MKKKKSHTTIDMFANQCHGSCPYSDNQNRYDHLWENTPMQSHETWHFGMSCWIAGPLLDIFLKKKLVICWGACMILGERFFFFNTYKITIECTWCLTLSFGFDVVKVLVLLSASEGTTLRNPCRRRCVFGYWTQQVAKWVAGGFGSRMHATLVCVCAFGLNRQRQACWRSSILLLEVIGIFINHTSPPFSCKPEIAAETWN